MFHKRPALRGSFRFRSSTLLLGYLVLGWLKSPEIACGQASEAAKPLADQQIATHDQASDQHKPRTDLDFPSVPPLKYASVYNWTQNPTTPASLVVGSNTMTLSP